MLERGPLDVRGALVRLALDDLALLFERALELLCPLDKRVVQNLVEGTTTLLLSHEHAPAAD